MLTMAEVDALKPGDVVRWCRGIHTPYTVMEAKRAPGVYERARTPREWLVRLDGLVVIDATNMDFWCLPERFPIERE